MPRISGDKAVTRKLRGLAGKEKVEFVGKALEVAGGEIKAFAQNSITEGSVGGAMHVPSKPGEPPNADTGILHTSIEVHRVAPLRVQVVAEAPYAAALEFGTSKMIERPYMRPAAKAKRARTTELVGKAVTIAVRKG